MIFFWFGKFEGAVRSVGAIWKTNVGSCVNAPFDPTPIYQSPEKVPEKVKAEPIEFKRRWDNPRFIGPSPGFFNLLMPILSPQRVSCRKNEILIRMEKRTVIQRFDVGFLFTLGHKKYKTAPSRGLNSLRCINTSHCWR